MTLRYNILVVSKLLAEFTTLLISVYGIVRTKCARHFLDL